MRRRRAGPGAEPRRRPADRGVALQRQQTFRRLAAACADGRLTAAELVARTAAAQRATSYDELRHVLADLPGPADGAVAGSRRAARGWLIGFLGICASSRFPALRPRVLAVAVAGEVVIDLARTPLTAFDTQIVAIAAAGGEVAITVPPGVRVQVGRARAVAADPASSGGAAPAGPLAPVVRIVVVPLLGGVRIEDTEHRRVALCRN